MTAPAPGAARRRLRVGVVGTGLIAQVMHLHYLAELADRFEVAAVCDIVPGSARACADRYRIPAAFTDWRELIRQPLDAVMILTSGSHAPIATSVSTSTAMTGSRVAVAIARAIARTSMINTNGQTSSESSVSRNIGISTSRRASAGKM